MKRGKIGTDANINMISGMLPDALYVLKHKDLDVAMVQINPFSGRIEYILEVYLPEELPIGCSEEEVWFVQNICRKQKC